MRSAMPATDLASLCCRDGVVNCAFGRSAQAGACATGGGESRWQRAAVGGSRVVRTATRIRHVYPARGAISHSMTQAPVRCGDDRASRGKPPHPLRYLVASRCSVGALMTVRTARSSRPGCGTDYRDVDALDLKSSSERSADSTPATRTICKACAMTSAESAPTDR